MLDTAFDIAACMNARLEGPAVSAGQLAAPLPLDPLSLDVPPARKKVGGMVSAVQNVTSVWLVLCHNALGPHGAAAEKAWPSIQTSVRQSACHGRRTPFQSTPLLTVNAVDRDVAGHAAHSAEAVALGCQKLGAIPSLQGAAADGGRHRQTQRQRPGGDTCREGLRAV